MVKLIRLNFIVFVLLAAGLFQNCSPGYVASKSSSSGATSNESATVLDGVTISGNQFMRFGQIFVPRGVQLVGMVAPLDVFETVQNDLFILAQHQYGPDELAAAKTWGIDTIRFQLGQAPLDTGDPLYHPDYINTIRDAVSLARKAGFVVIVSIQAGSASGTDLHQALPSLNTLVIWKQLASMWKNDSGIIFHMYTQPGVAPLPENWVLWREGGHLAAEDGQNGNPGHIEQDVVGMQELINGVRSVGSKNVILIPGLGNEKTIEGMLPLNDSAQALAFAVHSQPLDPLHGGGEINWNANFGSYKSTLPVMVAEWGGSAKYHNCTATMPQDAETFVAYLKKMQIGVAGFAFDISGTLTEGCVDKDCSAWSYAPTTYTLPFVCGGQGGGNGTLLKNYYLSQ